jgi:hypothetical protein
MRARLFSIGIVLLTLFAGGWGSVIAATLCPHMAQDHSCCPVAQSPANTTHTHQSMKHMDGMSDMDMSGPSENADDTDSIIANSLAGPVGNCGHCMGRSENPATPAASTSVGLGRQGTDIVPFQPAPQLVELDLSFALPVSARQHAPPKLSATARHVLISVFLI